MNKNKIVQVFIPTFNRCLLLEKAIESILNQDYPSVEIVVLDNASTDGTQDLMDEWVQQNAMINYYRNPINTGMTSNFNRIGPQVNQPFFCVLTDDDVYEPHFISTAMALFDKYPSAAFVGTCAPIQSDGKVVCNMLEGWEEGLHKKGTKIRECSQSRHPLFTHCVFRSYLAQEFIFHDKIWMVADAFLLTCFATKYDMAISKTVTGYWNLHCENATLKQVWDPIAYLECLTSISSAYDKFCKKNGLQNKLSSYHKKKIFIGMLQVGRDKSIFQRVIQREDIQKIFSPSQLFLIDILCKFRFLDLSLQIKSCLRKIGVGKKIG